MPQQQLFPPWRGFRRFCRSVLPIYATAAAMSRIGASRTAIIGSLGPMLSILLSIIILDEHLSPIQ
ncbi:EamA family transporter [Iodobacter fluviatilis]|uniref:EamA family transporter n=1 Tax=Iodobacter fluviatilis TaxID=537 RepID=UPI0040436BBD